jgi:GTP-binding protein
MTDEAVSEETLEVEPEQPVPLVAIIGRPNVGKSTLFNRLVRQRLAIVHDRPGVTRDRHYARAESMGRHYILVDTGGFDPSGDDIMKEGIVAQVQIAVDQADAILCVLDGTAAPTSIDSEEVELLRRSHKPVLYVANKADSARAELDAQDLFRLGMDRLICVSAQHGRGIPELEEAIADVLDAAEAAGGGERAPIADEGTLRVAVVGRPNAGKSSLVNRLLGEDRLLVDARPGTTRDAIDTIIERKGKRYLFVDTAGLRRKAQVQRSRDAVEAMSVLQAIRAIERAEVVVLLHDGTEPIADQDAKILSLAIDRGRAVVVALNKIDLLDADAQKAAERAAKDNLTFMPWAPLIKTSAKTGRGVDKLLETCEAVRDATRQRIGTGELNRFFEEVLQTHPPPTHGGKAPRFYFITQAESAPPTFVIVTSHPDHIQASYERYVKNAIRKRFGFEGAPLRVFFRRKDRRPPKKKRR